MEPGARPDPFYDLLQSSGTGLPARPQPPAQDVDFGVEDAVLPSYDFHLTRPQALVAQGTKEEATSSRLGSPPTKDSANGDHVQHPGVSLAQQVTMAAIEKAFAKHLEGVSTRLEVAVKRIEQVAEASVRSENTLNELRKFVSDSHGELDGRTRLLENMVREVQRSVQVLRDRQEIAAAAAELSKMQLPPPHSTPAPPAAPEHTDESATAPPPPLALPPPVPQAPASALAPSVPPVPAAVATAPPGPSFQGPPPGHGAGGQAPPSYHMPAPGPRPPYHSQQMPPPPGPGAPPQESYQPQPPPQVPPQQVHPASQPVPVPQQSAPPQYHHAPPNTYPPGPSYPPHLQATAPPTGYAPNVPGMPEGQYGPPSGYGGPPPEQQYAPQPPSYGGPPPEAPQPYNPQQVWRPPVAPRPQHPGAYDGPGGGGPMGHAVPQYAPHSLPVAQPVPVSAASPPRFPTAQPVPQSSSGAGSAPPGGAGRMSVDKVVEDVANMGFSRDEVRAVIRRLTENGQSVDLNIVLDTLMKGGGGGGGGGGDSAPPRPGWFGAR